jgi:hypothetical protein
MSTIVAVNHQVGADGTAANNFTIFQPVVPDGTLRIGNGNSGSATTVATITSTGNLTVAGTISSSGSSSTAGSFSINGTSSAGADIKLYEDTDNGTNYVALKAPDNVPANLMWTLPSIDGAPGQALTTNGTGTLTWAVSLPDQTGNAYKYLTTNGTTASWGSLNGKIFFMGQF